MYNTMKNYSPKEIMTFWQDQVMPSFVLIKGVINPLGKVQGSTPQKQILAPLQLGESKVGKFGIFVTLLFYNKSTSLMLVAYLIS
jgi:fumarate reductase subunit D